MNLLIKVRLIFFFEICFKRGGFIRGRGLIRLGRFILIRVYLSKKIIIGY